MKKPLSPESFLKYYSLEDNKYSPILWARNIFKDPERYIILDTETTGLGNAEVVEIAVINLRSEVLLNTLVKPLKAIPESVIDIHGISNEMVENAPTFSEIYPKLWELLEGKVIIIYNEAFDVNILQYCCCLNGLHCLPIDAQCLMLQYAKFYEQWSEYWKGYKWQKLPYGNHRALEDCKSALKLLFQMAGTYHPLIDSFEKTYQKYLKKIERENRPPDLDAPEFEIKK